MTGGGASTSGSSGLDRLAIGGRRGGLWIAAAALLSAICSLLAQLAFERALGLLEFARFAYLTSLLGLLVPVACMGSNHLLLSEFFQGRLVSREDASRLISYFLAFSALALLVFLPLYRHGAPPPQAGLPLLLLGVLFLAQVPVNIVFPVFQGRGQTRWVALWPLIQVLLRAAVGVVAILAAWSLYEAVLAWTIVCVSLAAIAISQLLPSLKARMKLKPQLAESHRFTWQRTRATLASGLVFGLSDMLDALDLKLLVPLAALLFSAVETAAAGLAVVILSAAFFFPYVLITRILLPAIHRAPAHGGSSEVRALVLRLSAWSLAVLLPITVLVYAYGYPLIARIVRGDYSSQATALSGLAFCLAPLCISQLAAAPHMQRESTWRLLWWRLEALAIFVAMALGWRSLGLTSLVLGFAVGRLWLSARVLNGLRTQRSGP